MEPAEDVATDGLTRRNALARMGTGLLVAPIPSLWGPIRPAEARVRDGRLRYLSPREARTLEALGDVLLPDAREAGIAHYVDDPLGRDAPLFILRYTEYPGPYHAFYSRALEALERLSVETAGQPFERVRVARQIALVRHLSQGTPPGWNGPPAPLVYFVIRNDALDAYYGNPLGFAKLGIPCMAHIMPPRRW
jgi:hypothetical protein